MGVELKCQTYIRYLSVSVSRTPLSSPVHQMAPTHRYYVTNWLIMITVYVSIFSLAFISLTGIRCDPP